MKLYLPLIVLILSAMSCKTESYVLTEAKKCDEPYIEKTIEHLGIADWKTSAAEKLDFMKKDMAQFTAQEQWEDGVHYSYAISLKNAEKHITNKEKPLSIHTVKAKYKSSEAIFFIHVFSDYDSVMNQALAKEIIKLNEDQFEFVEF